MRILFLASLLVAACEKGPGGGGPDMARPLDGAVSVTIGPFQIGSGVEIVKCAVVKVPFDVDTDVVRIHTDLAPGSHHLILYRSVETQEQPPYDCTSFAGVFNGEAPVFIAESADSDMQLPTGVAYHFTAGQMVRLEAHYINTTQATLNAQGTVYLVAGATGMTYQPADMMMCGSVGSLACQLGGGVHAGDSNYTLPVGFYDGTAVNLRGPAMNVDLTKLKIFAFTSHEHHHGKNVTIWKSTGHDVAMAQKLYSNDSWDNPPLKVLPDDQLLTFATNEGFAWQCSYDASDTTTDLCFGESANDEMCFIWAYYFPSVGRFIAQDDCWAN
jgi:hypothetical protein